jgi:hypothetical protein
MITLKKVVFLLVATAAAVMAQYPGTAAAPPDTNARDFKGDYSPITAQERFDWILQSTIGPKNLAAGLVTSGWGTWHNNPPEYSPHWEGYAKRYGLRLTVGGTSNVMEAGLGSLWGEDPRYFGAAGQPLGRRLVHVFGGAFMTHNRQGNAMPAYARYLAVPSATFLSNTWRPDSQATAADASIRIGLGFTSRIVGNAFSEFLPDLRKHKFKKQSSREAI